MSETPKVVVFSCNWSVYPGLQLSRLLPKDEEDKPFENIVTMCSGRVSPELVMEAFARGAWGVMVAGCPPDECEHDGNYKTRRRMTLLKSVLKDFGIDPERLGVAWFKVDEAAKLSKTINEFVDKIGQMGPIVATHATG
jgi:coenzyme F420-reducing hydrogenase delta subunit